MAPPYRPKPKLPDWAPTRDPKRNAEIDAEVRAEFKREQDEKNAHLARLKAMEPTLIDRRTRCGLIYASFQTEWQIRKNNWSMTIIDLAQVYRHAFENFVAEFDKGTAENAQSWVIAAFAMASILQGSLAGLATFAAEKWVKSAAAKTLIGAESTVAQGLLGGFIQLPPSDLVTGYAEASITKPADYKDELDKMLIDLDTTYLSWISAQQKLIAAVPLEKFEFMTPETIEAQAQAFLDKQEKNSKPLAMDKTGATVKDHYASDEPKKTRMRVELEKAMWMRYFQLILPEQHGAARAIRFYVVRVGRMPEFLIDKMADLKLIDRHSGYDDVDVLKMADDPAGPEPRRIIAKAMSRANLYQPEFRLG